MLASGMLGEYYFLISAYLNIHRFSEAPSTWMDAIGSINSMSTEMGINGESCWFLYYFVFKIALYFVGGRNVRTPDY
jgi:hypothetical protein